MLVRTISAVVFLIVVLPCIYFSSTPLLVAFCFLLSVGAVYEMLKCNGLHKNIPLSVSMYLIAFLPILPRMLGTELFYRVAFPLVSVCTFLVLSVYTVLKQKPDFGKVMTSWLFSLYATIGFTSLILLSDLCGGKWHIMFLAFIASWITDTFALLTGMLFGRHKLLPSVSPKKTIEGAIGGVVFCVIAFLLYSKILESVFNFEIKSYLLIALCGLLSSIIVIFGDLIFSAVKRTTGIKDFGNIMPGHGGILDRFDSLVSISTALLIFITVTNIF